MSRTATDRERDELRALCHKMRGAMNNLGTALSLMQIQANGQAELKTSVDVALRGFIESKEIFERIVSVGQIDEEGP